MNFRVAPLSLIALITVGSVACGTLASVSSGHVGCAEQDITITDDSPGLMSRTWTAECQGKRYFCSSHGGGNRTPVQISCSPEAEEKPAPPPKPTNDGCKHDTQCKGDRICRAGTCVDP